MTSTSLTTTTTLGTSTTTTTNSTTSTTLIQGPGGQLKLGIKEDGIYKLGLQDLQNAGLNITDIDPRTIKITHRGVEVPILVSGESDGDFDPSDFIEFYGTGVSRDAPEFEVTDTDIYWLSTGGTDGIRIQERDGTPGGNVSPDSFQNTIHMEQDTFYTQVIPNGGGKDHWFWGGLIRATDSKNYFFTIKNNSMTKKDCTLRYYLQGKTDTIENPDHHTQVFLNNTLIDDHRWNGKTQLIREKTLGNCNLVNNGNNIIRLHSVGDTGALVDSVLFNWFEVDYWDQYVAENNVLVFNGIGASPVDFSIAGFGGNDIHVYDISDPLNLVKIINLRVDPVGSSYNLSFLDNFQGQRNYIALTSSEYKKPVNLFQDSPSTLKDLQNGADYIIIAHESLLSSVKPLADHRENKGGGAACFYYRCNGHL